MQEGQVVASRLLVADGNASVVVDVAYESLNLTWSVYRLMASSRWIVPFFFWRDDRFSLKRLDVCYEPVTVEALVADDTPGLKHVTNGSACAVVS